MEKGVMYERSQDRRWWKIYRKRFHFSHKNLDRHHTHTHRIQTSKIRTQPANNNPHFLSQSREPVNKNQKFLSMRVHKEKNKDIKFMKIPGLSILLWQKSWYCHLVNCHIWLIVTSIIWLIVTWKYYMWLCALWKTSANILHWTISPKPQNSSIKLKKCLCV